MTGVRRPEVLAPAGSFESMKAAVSAGADGVYIGGSRFGARAYADNPDESQLLEAIDYVHLHGVSLYMTVNTLMKEQELGELYDFLAPCWERGLDGVIVQDLGAAACIRQWFPGLPIHGSTQMTITGVYGARMLANLGFKRVVTARELSLEEIARIHREVPIEIESFVHGALCYCYSGQCLLSSFIGGRSGNRGRCAQPCRLPYQIISQDDARRGAKGQKGRRNQKAPDDRYLLSMKDLCTLDLLPDIMEAGVDSLKIEGRMKSPRYTAGVVCVYRKYVDRYLAGGRTGYQVDPADRRMLLDLFDRGGFTEGYYRQHNGPSMIARKEKPAFRQGNQELFDRLDRLYVETEKKEPVKGRLTVREGEPLTLELELLSKGPGQGIKATARGEAVQRAQNQPASRERLEKQIQKTGNTPFYIEELETELMGQAFVPVQSLNELRREGLESLKESILKPYRREAGARGDMTGQRLPGGAGESRKQGRAQRRVAGESAGRNKAPALHVLLPHAGGLSRVLEVEGVSQVILESDGAGEEQWQELAEQCHARGVKCVLAMPVIFREQAEEYFEKRISALGNAGFDGILARSLEEIGYLRGKGVTCPVYGDHNLYAWNSRARQALLELGCAGVTLPLELNARELADRGCRGEELTVYGFLPAMVSAQCVRRTISGCTKRPEWLTMKDRTGKELLVRNHCDFCYNVIYNPDPLSLMDQAERILEMGLDSVRLDFTKESVQEMEQITRAWAGRLSGREEPKAGCGEFTRGHFRRGVE